MDAYRVRYAIQRGAERIAPGAVVELDEAEAAGLIEAGAVEPAETTPPSPGGDDRPLSPESGREPSLTDAIAGMDPLDAAAWTKSGAPQLAALRAAAGRDVTAAERDEAWAAHLAARKSAGAD